MRTPLLLLACLTLACAGSDPKALTDAGSAALNSGDARGAVASFDRALEHMDAAHPDYLRASLGRCQALARFDSGRAKDDFLSLARAQPSKVREADFTALATELVHRGAIAPAVSLAEEGMKMFPESPSMKSLRDFVGDAAKKASDPAALQRLKGLGYAGDG
jgi:hypothetical protein